MQHRPSPPPPPSRSHNSSTSSKLSNDPDQPPHQPSLARRSPSDGPGGEEEPPLIELVNVSKSFGSKQILRDASITIRRGEAVGIIGGSGTGKSTTLRLMAGLLAPDSGEVRIAGVPRRGLLSDDPAADGRVRVGLVFQFPERHFLGETLVEELTFGWPPAEPPALRAARGARAQAVLRALALDDLPLQARLRDLSDGYKRRVALAVQLSRSPDALLLDEPLAGLDWRARKETAAALAAAKAQCCVLCVTHDLAELTPLVDGGAWAMGPGGKLRRAKWPPSKEKKRGGEASSSSKTTR